MKIGDLVTLRWGEGRRAAGMIMETHHSGGNDSIAYREVRVQWLDDGGKDVSWVMPKDLEIINENR